MLRHVYDIASWTFGNCNDYFSLFRRCGRGGYKFKDPDGFADFAGSLFCDRVLYFIFCHGADHDDNRMEENLLQFGEENLIFIYISNFYVYLSADIDRGRICKDSLETDSAFGGRHGKSD